MSEAAAVVVPVNENIPPADKAPPAEPVSAAPAAAPLRRSGRGFVVLCALLALAGAAVALGAPGLRAPAAAFADEWLGRDNMIAGLLVPPAVAPVPDVTMQTLAELTMRLDRITTTQQAMAADLAHAIAELRADRAASQGLVRAVDELSRQTADLRDTATAIDARGRASGLLALSLRLRRDVDAGLPLDRDLAALAVTGPYPTAVDRALSRLRASSDGTPTMRDLADELDRVLADIAARSGGATSWLRGGWNRVAGVFGGGTPADSAGLTERLRALAADGRFTEAASEIAASEVADLGAGWATRVRLRANAVLATQALLSYSLAAYETAYATTGVR